ncbi:MAG: carboxypeptidase-like regulatory domain-containing protein, partial [Balneolaceae bacterium]
MASNLLDNELFFSVPVYSERIAELKQIITIRMEDVSVKEALEEIARKGGLGIAYNANLEALNRTVTLDHQVVTVGNALVFALEGTGYEPAISRTREIVLLPKPKEDTAGPEEYPAEAYQEIVEGQVVDAATSQTLPGVNIVVSGTAIGTVTDADGNFSINLPSLNDTLLVSYIGYQTREVPVDGRSNIRVTLDYLVVAGEEMVVTAFGLQREVKSLTYSTQTVNTEQLTEARELNVISSLQGRVAGLSINQSGSGVGAPNRVILRGNRSISGDSQPLYVIDGVPVRGNPGDLNPDNIASIDVLKGPNAAALYGSAAQNGAIVIETHRGEAGVVNVRLNNTFMVQEPVHNIQFQNEYAQGLGGNYISSSEESWGPRMEGQMVNHWSILPGDAGRQYALNPQPDNVSDGFQRGFNLANNIHVGMGADN